MKIAIDSFWHWLGFRRAKVDGDQPAQWLAAGVHSSRVDWQLPWLWRLRILISGKIEVDSLHRLDVMPGRWETLYDIAVLPPNWQGETYRRGERNG